MNDEQHTYPISVARSIAHKHGEPIDFNIRGCRFLMRVFPGGRAVPVKQAEAEEECNRLRNLLYKIRSDTLDAESLTPDQALFTLSAIHKLAKKA